MSKQRKTVLVSLGKRTREVTFESGSDSECERGCDDLILLKKAIRQELADHVKRTAPVRNGSRMTARGLPVNARSRGRLLG